MPVLSCFAKLCLFSIQPKIALETKKKKEGREPLVLNHPHVSGMIFWAVFLPAYLIYFLFVFKHGTSLQLVRANKLETKKENTFKNPSWGNDVINRHSVRGN